MSSYAVGAWVLLEAPSSQDAERQKRALEQLLQNPAVKALAAAQGVQIQQIKITSMQPCAPPNGQGVRR